MISGPNGIYICDECISVCADAMMRDSGPAPAAGRRASRASTCPRPPRPRQGTARHARRGGAGGAHARRARRRTRPTRRPCWEACPPRTSCTRTSPSTWWARKSRQARPLGGRVQPLQAHQPGRGRRRGGRGAGQEQHHAARSHRFRQDASGPDARPHAAGAVRHRGRHHAHRGGLRGRGRGEHPVEAHHGGGLRHPPRRDRHRLHRRDRQDRPQGGEPLHHARRVGRGRAAGAAQDRGRLRGQRAPAGRAQAPPAGTHPHRHHEHPVHPGRGVRGAGRHRGAARGQERPGLRRRAAGKQEAGRSRASGAGAARRPEQVRHDPRVRGPHPGDHVAFRAFRGRPGAHPHRAEERPWSSNTRRCSTSKTRS